MPKLDEQKKLDQLLILKLNKHLMHDKHLVFLSKHERSAYFPDLTHDAMNHLFYQRNTDLHIATI
jgi:hypothetical protein